MVRGIDVSKWQGDIDWQAVAAGIKFAFIRASHGDSVDLRFVDNWRGAVGAGVIPGAYHYYECPGAIAGEQAHTFLDQLCRVWAPELPGLPPVLDVEEGRPKAQELLEWLDIVRLNTGLCPWIYTSTGWWTPTIGNNDRFSRYPLWVAHWDTKTPRVPLPWTDWIVWQKTNKGRVPGIKTNVDLNEFNGSIEDLRWMARINSRKRCADRYLQQWGCGHAAVDGVVSKVG